MAYTTDDIMEQFFASINDDRMWGWFLAWLRAHGNYSVEVPGLTHAEWREHVAKGNTLLGYWETMRAEELHYLNDNE